MQPSNTKPIAQYRLLRYSFCSAIMRMFPFTLLLNTLGCTDAGQSRCSHKQLTTLLQSTEPQQRLLRYSFCLAIMRMSPFTFCSTHRIVGRNQSINQSCTIAMFKTGHWLMADAIANTRIVPEVHMGVTRACSSESWLIQCRRKDNTPQ